MSILSFVNGLELDGNNFSDGCLVSDAVQQFAMLHTLRLNKTRLNEFPRRICDLPSLNEVQLCHNRLKGVPSDISKMKELTNFVCRDNAVNERRISSELFNLPKLTILDLSRNDISTVPEELELAKQLLVLNLSCNNVESISTQLFVNLTDLTYLDLSNNRLMSLPAQLRRLINLKVLRLSNNPLVHAQLRQIPALVKLEVLHLRNTDRNAANFPTGLETLVKLRELDISANNLQHFPDAVHSLSGLEVLDVSENQLEELPTNIADSFPRLEVLHCSRNLLRCLPSSVIRLIRLRRLFVNSNQLTFDGLPAGIGKLSQLEVFSAADNQLKAIPDSLCRCPNLRRLILNANQLVTLPVAIHLMELEKLDIEDNPDLVMPKRPPDATVGSGIEYYNIDFSLKAQLKAAMNLPAANSPDSKSDSKSRKLRLMRQLRLTGLAGGRTAEPETESGEKVLRAMRRVTEDKQKDGKPQSADDPMTDSMFHSPQSKRWDERLEKPKINYEKAKLFSSDVGQHAGLEVFEIADFQPVPMDPMAFGAFYTEDCYVVLDTSKTDQSHFKWRIWYWLGKETTLDKQASAAIHAVNLRNMLGATCRTIRVEMLDEPDDFRELFIEYGGISLLQGANHPSGFYTVVDVRHETKIYRVPDPVNLCLEYVENNYLSFDPRFCFIVDAGMTIWVWHGVQSNVVLRSKARLLAEKLCKIERKGQAQISQVVQGREPEEFSQVVPGTSQENISEHLVEDYNLPRLYAITLGRNKIELTQVSALRSNGQLLPRSVLIANAVLILDCHSEIFVWLGKKSRRLFQTVGVRLARELSTLIDRPGYSVITICTQGTEPVAFRLRFSGWDDVMPVDFRRTAQSIAKRGADMEEIMRRDQIHINLAALFAPRQPVMDAEQCEEIITEVRNNLDWMKCFVLEGRKFIPLPDKERGHFFSGCCYVFLCRFWENDDDDSVDDATEKQKSTEKLNDTYDENGVDETPSASSARQSNSKSPTPIDVADGSSQSSTAHRDRDSIADDSNDAGRFRCKVFFWQGRDASKLGWLTFHFSMQKKFEEHFGDLLDIERISQQQETYEFLALFHPLFVIHAGSRPSKGDGVTEHALSPDLAFYEIRSNGAPLTLRCVELEKVDSKLLCSNFCYILKVPFWSSARETPEKTDDASKSPEEQQRQRGAEGISYVWVGSLAQPSDVRIAEHIARNIYKADSFAVQVIEECQEPENFFWLALNGRPQGNFFPRPAEFLGRSRLFRCSNETGEFVVSEKCIDFCQDDLSDNDVMIVDTGDTVYLWIGARSSVIEVKFSFKSAQIYIQYLKCKHPEDPVRRLALTGRGKEPSDFCRCFHAWSHHKPVY